jgi:hypothetical protein
MVAHLGGDGRALLARRRTIAQRWSGAALTVDVVEMEKCYQHAEQYLRVMRGTGDERRAEL